MPDVNQELNAAEKKLEKAAQGLSQAADALAADRLVETVAGEAVPDLAANAVADTLTEAPPAAKPQTLDEALSALADSAAKTKFDEEVMKAES